MCTVIIMNAGQLLERLIALQQSPAALARQIGISISTVTRLLARDRPVRVATLAKISKALGVDFRTLIKEE